jgi:hypothetical protein
MPIRIQRKRTKGWKMPENTVSVTRPGKWGNPFVVGKLYQNSAWYACMFPYDEFIKKYKEDGIKPTDASEAIKLYEIHIKKKIEMWPETMKKEIESLRGKNLACFCPLDKPCHADVLLKIANQ